MEWPTVSVIVLNFNGRQHLAECLGSLTKMEYPAEKLELLLVDNASSDGSVAFAQEAFPSVRIVQNPDNLGFAAGNNRGAEAATGDYIAFLNNDTRVDPKWVKELVRPCLEEEDVACTASKMLSWDGKVTDFACSAMNFHGFAFQPDHGLPDTFHERIPLLFACGGAMLIKREIFLGLGGFDEDYFIYFEDMDLGWRLWITGHRVLFAPDAIVYHRLHATMDAFTSFRKWVLFERNALMTLIKNYDEANLHKALSASLLLMFRRAGRLMQAHGWDVRPYYIRNAQGADLHESVSRAGLSVLVAANEVIDQLPQLFEKRARIQQQRRRSDAEVFQQFELPSFVHPILHQDAQAHYDIVHHLGVGQLFRDVPRRVLLLSQAEKNGATPGHPAEAARLAAMGERLNSAGHAVFYGVMGDEKAYTPIAGQSRQTVYSWGKSGLNSLIDSINPEIIVALDGEILAQLENCPLPLVFAPARNGQLPPRTNGSNGFPISVDLQTQEDWEALAHFCQTPRKLHRQHYSESASESGSEGSAFATPPPPKSVRQLAQEAAFHFRQRGVKGFLYEFFGFLQKQVEKRL